LGGDEIRSPAANEDPAPVRSCFVENFYDPIHLIEVKALDGIHQLNLIPRWVTHHAAHTRNSVNDLKITSAIWRTKSRLEGKMKRSPAASQFLSRIWQNFGTSTFGFHLFSGG
jgi:hypothetical protein